MTSGPNISSHIKLHSARCAKEPGSNENIWKWCAQRHPGFFRIRTSNHTRSSTVCRAITCSFVRSRWSCERSKRLLDRVLKFRPPPAHPRPFRCVVCGDCLNAHSQVGNTDCNPVDLRSCWIQRISPAPAGLSVFACWSQFHQYFKPYLYLGLAPLPSTFPSCGR